MTKFDSPDSLAVLAFASPAEFEEWLEREHQNVGGLWIAIAKKASGVASIDHPGALETALCFGWIDGQRRSYDDTYFLQRFTPRRSRSPWSKINRAKAEVLIAEGRMRPAGQSEVDRARADGRWEAAYDGARTIEVPADLQKALDENPEASKAFARLKGQNRYSILYRINEAKRAETRARRIEKYVAMLARGEAIR